MIMLCTFLLVLLHHTTFKYLDWLLSVVLSEKKINSNDTEQLVQLAFFLGAAKYNFTFVPHFTRFHWPNNMHVKI